MSQGDEPRDPRETLTELERRLLDLERELRASGDLPAAAPVPGADEVPAPAAPAAGVEPAPSDHAAPAMLLPDAASVGVPVELDALVEEARVRAHALRTSLDSLLGVNDHLRETAGTVVSDHGETLTQLDRALASHAAVGEPGGVRGTPVPGIAATPHAPAADPAAVAPLAGVPHGEPVWERPAVHRRPRGRRLVTAFLLLLLLAALAAAAYVIRERRRDNNKAATTATVPTVAVGVPAAMEAGVVGARRFAPANAAQAVCSGLATAAILDTPGQPSCAPAVIVARVTDSAFGLVGPRRRGRGRRCISMVAGGDLAPHNDSASLNALRSKTLARARAGAVNAAHTDGLTPAQALRAGSAAALSAANGFDQQRRLTALGVSKTSGAACIKPTQANIRSGTYPLAHQLTVIAAPEAQASPAVTAAVASLQTAYGGPVALDAHVLH